MPLVIQPLQPFLNNVAVAASDAVEVAEPATSNSIKTVNEKILLVVDKGILNDNKLYPGLSTKRNDIKPATLKDRIDRYSNDIINSTPLTDVQTLVFDNSTDTASSLSLALETLYNDSNKMLSGVVLIGNIPLPVVNKAGNQFVSILPYTDLTDKSYIYNNSSNTFDYNPDVSLPKSEIWHGIMRPSGDDAYSLNEFATYLDKNHLFHNGDDDFSNFGKRVFFGDFINEEKNLNRNLYSQYLNYLDKLEDVAYLRYNKFWANNAQSDVKIPTNQNDDAPEDAAEFASNLENMNTAGMPDIFAKQIVDKQLVPYYRLATKYLGTVSKLISNTGRYSKDDVLTPVSIISMKDEYAKTYLKNVNDLIEKEINSLVNTIQTPLSLIDSAEVYVDSKDAPHEYSNYFNFNYKNEVTNEHYLNGIKTDNLASVKQCSVFLGSSKNEYFDKNGVFNPKSKDVENGEYSIITRDIRADSPSTATPLNTTGINTRLLSPDEARTKTDNKVSYGALITPNLEYGIPAFLKSHNTSYTLAYKNPLDGPLKEGDIITAINGEKINPLNSYDLAISNMYDKAFSIVSDLNGSNQKKVDLINKDISDGKYSLTNLLSVSNYYPKTKSKIKNAVVNFDLEFYRDGHKYNKTFSFSVNKKGVASKKSASGDTKLIISFKNVASPKIYSDGVIFTLYKNDDGNGFNGDGYSIDAGCNANNTSYMGGDNNDIPYKNIDRCFYSITMMPLLDVSGGVNISKTEDGFYFDNGNSEVSNENLYTDFMQLPVNDDSKFYSLEDIDEIYLDSCFNGLPASVSTSTDKNEFLYPADATSNILPNDSGKLYTPGLDAVNDSPYSVFHKIKDEDKDRLQNDFYARLLSKMGNFIKPDGDFQDGNNSAINASESVWDEVSKLDASDIILYKFKKPNSDKIYVTLKNFSDVYGIFDGIDNDGDGIVDYEMRDLKDENGEDGTDGVAETRWYGDNFPEANIKYGIPSNNLPAIYRRMFSKNRIFILPSYLSPTGTELTLTVKVNKNRDLSSVILHNEPTPYTLSTQMKSMTTSALPIDNPRYVVFLNPSGNLERIDYPNTFRTSSFAQLNADLNVIATRLSLLKNSYLIFGENASPNDHSAEEIKNEILNNHLLPLIDSEVDVPENGRNLTAAATEKIYDAIKWINLDIDQKHAYTLEYYLNPEKKAFISDSKNGFESAYLVFDGDSSSVSFGFNKIEATDKNPLFDPIAIANSNSDEANVEETASETNSDSEFDINDFVNLKQFMKEVNLFVDDFKNIFNGKNWENACQNEDETADYKDETTNKATEVSAIKIEPESTVLLANGKSKTHLNIKLLDSNGNIAGGSFNDLSIFSSDLTYFSEFDDLDSTMTGTQITANEGVASIDLISKDKIGSSTISAVIMDKDLENKVINNEGKFIGIDFSKYITDSVDINLVKSVDLKFEQFGSAIAGDTDVLKTKISLFGDDKLLTGYNSDIIISSPDDTFGVFESIPKKMKNGSISSNDLVFHSSKKSGEVVVYVEVPGFVSKTFTINVLPNSPYEVRLSSESKNVFINDEVVLNAGLYDKFGNIVKTDSESIMSFEVTDYSKVFANFGSTHRTRLLNGVANIKLYGGKVSGIANITANIDNGEENTIKTGTLSLRVKSNIDINNVKEIAPKALYITLLGSDFGNIANGENVAQSLLYSGETQAISTLSANSSSFRSIKFNPDGTFKVLDPNIIQSIIPSSKEFPHTRIVFTDQVKQVQIGEFFLILPNNEDAKLISDNSFESEDFDSLMPNGENANVTVLTSIKGISELSYGAYFVPNSSDKVYSVEKFFSGSSTQSGLGLYVVDNNTPILPAQKPGFGYSSLDNAEDDFGIGFKGDNKSMLLFSSGNNVGESNKPYNSEIGLIYGDPTVKLGDTYKSSLLPFESTLGKPLFSGNDKIKEIINADMNNDGHEDLLSVYENGDIRLFENEISNDGFKDMGIVIRSNSEILSATTIDVNNDGYNDVLIGTKEACHVNDDCLNLYTNVRGEFEHKSLSNMIDGQAYELKGADMNKDGCQDLVVSDSSGTIRLFYNTIKDGECAGLSTKSTLNKNFGPVMNANVNQKNNLFVYYPGIAQPTDKNISSLLAEHAFLDFGYLNGSKYNSDSENRTENPKKYFQSILYNDALSVNSKKTAVDLNGGSLGVGDVVKYTITLQNDSETDISRLNLSDLLPSTFTLDFDSLKCLDLNCSDELSFEGSDISNRNTVITGISIPSGSKRIISYKMTVDAMPKIGFTVGNNFTQYKTTDDELIPSDELPDIFVQKELNPNKTLTYLYSKGLNSNGEVNFGTYVYQNTSEKNTDNNDNDATVTDELFNMDSSASSPPDDAIDKMKKQMVSMYADLDFDGISDSLSGFLADVNEKYHEVTDKVESLVSNAIANTQCGGGCSPIPYNYAFLVPGVSDGVLQGFPAISFVPFLPFVYAFVPQQSVPSTFRLYLSPTATMNIGGAVCLGDPYTNLSPCFAFKLPAAIDPLAGVCEDIIDGIKKGIDKATSFAADNMPDVVKDAISVSSSNSNPDVGMTTIAEDGENNDSSDFSTGNFSSGGSDSPIAYSGSVNVRVPGFPGIITDWIDSQTDEVYNKLLDFPDMYIYYPDPGSLIPDFETAGENFGDINNINDVLNAINSIPLVQLETRELMLKVPIISKDEIIKYKVQGEKWIAYEKAEWERAKAAWMCDDNSENKTICDAVSLDVTALIRSVEDLMAQIDAIATIPDQILDLRAAEAKYANQIICYLDTVMKYTGGYITRQRKTIESWMKAVDNAIKAFRDWKMIFNLAVDYQESCDECKNDRFSKLGLLMNLFVAIPSLPIIQIPKWPDVVVDLSQVQSGLNIVWPDIQFVPKKLLLPNIPTFRIPDVIPDISYKIPTIDIPNLEIPDIKFKLPNLPKLILPKLPDLPRPPKIFKLPKVIVNLAADLKPIFKILCLLKKGLVPIPEGSLKTQIETLTQPSVQAVFELLPLAADLGQIMPGIEYDWLEKVQINVSVNASMSTDFIYDAVKFITDKSNKYVDKYANLFNKYSTFPIQAVIDNYTNKVEDSVNNTVSNSINKVEKSTEDAVDKTFSYDNKYNEFSNLISLVHSFSEKMQQQALIAKEENKNIPEQYYISATENEKLDPKLNRNLAQIKADVAINDSKYSGIIAQNSQLNNISNLRDSLIAYSDDLENNFSPSNNYKNQKSISTLIAKLNSKDDVLRFASRLNSTDTSVNNSNSFDASKPLQLSLTGNSYAKEKRTLLASVSDPTKAEIQETSSTAASSTDALPKGFYLSMDGNFGNILSYTDEIKNGLLTQYIDYDNDDDLDIIYTLGGNIYIKDNSTNSPVLGKGAVLNTISSINEVVSNTSHSVNGVNTDVIYNEKFDISWKDNNETYFYILTLKQHNDVKYRYLVIKEPLDSQAAIDIQKKYGNFDNSFEITTTQENDFILVSDSIKNGSYTGFINAYDYNFNMSLDNTTLITASSCADKDAPYPSFTKDSFEIPIFEKLILDASKSFDLSGHVVEYWIESLPYETEKPYTHIPTKIWSDLNVLVDSNGDGIKYNDKTNPLFKIGPFTKEGDLGEHKFLLNVVDQSGNSSNKEFTINVVKPKISIDFHSSDAAKYIFGEILPKYKAYFELFRKRNYYQSVKNKLVSFKKIEKISTPSEINGLYRTNEFGQYNIKDLNFNDMILVLDSDKNVVAEINPKTGNIGNLQDGYKVVVNAAVLPDSPLNIQILNPNNIVVATVFAVGDVNRDVKSYVNEHFEGTKHFAISVNELDDNFKFNLIGANSVQYTGGSSLKYLSENKNIAYIDTYGNLVSLDDRLSLKLKNNNYKTDELIISILFNKKIIGELLIPTNKLMKIAGINDIPAGKPSAPPTGELYNNGVFSDANSEINDVLYDLYKNGIIDGDEGANGLEIHPNEKITRAEFVEMLLKLLCVTPSESDYLPYSPNEGDGGFSDMIFNKNMPESYAYIKEANLLGLVNGYLGETNENGLHPFKPNNTISRAEATKIIINALSYRGVIDISTLKNKDNGIWSDAYISAGLDLSPYIISDKYLINSFIITQDEGKRYYEMLSRAQLFTMASRVLEFYNCFNEDLDNDGMSDFCERRYDINDPYSDIDNDGLNNAYECAYGLNPKNPDTDGGGVYDGVEVDNFTDPLKFTDDSQTFVITDDKDSNQGTYVVPAECDTCPCVSTITNKADVVTGDILFTAITNTENTFVFAKSNEIEVK